jgi:ABC-type transport system substrate-binding protein
MNRRDLLGRTAALAAAPGLAAAQPARGGPVANTFRVAFNVAETGFDPVAIGDENSNRVAACIFEAPLTYDYLARPPKLVPLTAEALPEVGDDHRTLTFRIRPGIFFAPDAAFGGQPRELVAQDYVYAIKRYYDPKLASENLYVFENAGLVGLSELRREAIRTKQPFDYDREVEGIRALDRTTFRVRLAAPAPRFVYQFARSGFAGAMAREVVERYGADVAAHPVGTGPYRLAAWRRASRIVLERNPVYRERRFEGTPAADDAPGQAVAAALAGRRLPVSDRIEISVIVESQPRWLAFAGGEIDQLLVPADLVGLAVPGGRLAPHLARRGVALQSSPSPDIVMTFFNMQDPVVGGLAPEKVALRRAVSLAWDPRAEIQLVRNGAGTLAQSVVPPGLSGYEADFRSEMSEHSPARARALLDLYGYADRDGDGWREDPQGRPLVLRLASTPSQVDRRLNELWRKQLAAVGLRMQFEVGNWGDLLKRSLAGSLQMWGFSWAATTPDGGFFLGIGYGPNADQSNDARFDLPAYDRLFEQQAVLPDGPGRDALIRRAKGLLVAHMPYKVRLHTVQNDLLQPWARGYRRHPFLRDEWICSGVEAAA